VSVELWARNLRSAPLTVPLHAVAVGEHGIASKRRARTLPGPLRALGPAQHAGKGRRSPWLQAIVPRTVTGKAALLAGVAVGSIVTVSSIERLLLKFRTRFPPDHLFHLYEGATKVTHLDAVGTFTDDSGLSHPRAQRA